MTILEKQSLGINKMLIYNPTNEPFYIVGLNTSKRDSGTIKIVSGKFKNGETTMVNLDECTISEDMNLMG